MPLPDWLARPFPDKVPCLVCTKDTPEGDWLGLPHAGQLRMFPVHFDCRPIAQEAAKAGTLDHLDGFVFFQAEE